MINDAGIYILVSPTQEDKRKEEYRVTYLDSTNNIVWELDQKKNTQVLNPSKVKSCFNKSKVYADDNAAREEAYEISNNFCGTLPPIFHIYVSTPYPQWSTSYDKKK